MAKSINLIHTENKTSFFKNRYVQDMKETILRFKEEKSFDLSDKDRSEIQRGKSYAVFPELRKNGVTEDSLRASLAKRGVVDPEFQNKILCILLQDKLGLHIGMGKIFQGVLIEAGLPLQMRSEAGYELSMKVNNKNEVTLVLKAPFLDMDENPALQASISFNITPSKVAISNFNVKKLSDTPIAKEAFEFLGKNQRSIGDRIASWFKQLFGDKVELARSKEQHSEQTLEEGNWSGNSP